MVDHNSAIVKSIEDALKALQVLVLDKSCEKLTLEVRRSHIIKDAVREARKDKFTHCKLLKVCIRNMHA